MIRAQGLRTQGPGSAAGRYPKGDGSIVWIPIPEAMALCVPAERQGAGPPQSRTPPVRRWPSLTRWIGRFRRSGTPAFASAFSQGSET